MVTQFASALSDKDKDCKAQIDEIKGATSSPDIPMPEVHSFASATRAGRKATRSASRGKRMKSKSAARAKKLGESRALPPVDAFIVTPPQDKSANTCKKELWTLIAKHLPSPRIHSVIGKSGRLVLKPRNKESADVLRKISKARSYNLHPDPPLLPRLRFDNIDRDLSPDDIPTQLISQNPELIVAASDASDFVTPSLKPVLAIRT